MAPSLVVFTPRAVAAPIAQLPLLREWTRKYGRFDAATALASRLNACGVQPHEQGGLVFSMSRSEHWWDLMAFLQSRGWRAVYAPDDTAIEGLPTYFICMCGRCE